MRYPILLVLLLILSLNGFGLASAFLISDQGTNVRNLTGSFLETGNLTISIYDRSTGGNVLFSSTVQNAIVNGSWNLMINPNLNYGLIYWKDYEINEEDLDFDGNERIEFQSSSGPINNYSFLNFSLINACPIGSAIRLVYANGSVECQASSNSSSSTDLTNYALKNQSETFAGNITTTDSGLFGFLGSLASRITKLFVRDIDASGNINSTGNVTALYFKGDGSLLTNIGAGAESDPIFVNENSTLWSVINSKLATSDQRYNNTALILSINATTNIMSLGFYNRTETDNLVSGIGAGNLSFNQSFANTLYYSIANPSGFINNTSLSMYNDTSLILTTNSSLWSYISVNEQNWASTFNLTYNNLLSSSCPSGYMVNGTLSNGTMTCIQPTLSESDPLWTANSTLVLYSNSLPLANRTIVHCSNITGASSNLCTVSNSAGNIFDQVLNTTSNVIFASVNATGEIYVANIAVKQWLYNQTAAANSYTDSVLLANNASWTSTYNATYASNQANSSWNQTLANTLYSNIQWNYNQSDGSYNATYASNQANNSWDETRANNLYAGIQWAYNQTNSFTNWLSAFVYDYNQTTPAVVYASNVNTSLSSRIDGITGTNSSFNQSLTDILYYSINNPLNFINRTQSEAYNDTLLILSINGTTNIMSLGFYNSSQVDSLVSNIGNSSFNQSLTDVLYYSANNPLTFINNTQASIYNDTNILLIVNSSLWNYINLNQLNWNLTYNSTYQNVLGQQCPLGKVVNGTLLNGTLSCVNDENGSGSANPFNQVLNTTSNATFENITVRSNSLFVNNVSASTGFFSFLGSALGRITKLFAVDLDVSNNITSSGNVSAQFYFGSLNKSAFPASACSGNDKVVSILSNGTVNCGTDQTGAGSGVSFTTFNMTLSDISTTNNVNYVGVLTLPLNSGQNVMIECTLLHDSAATGTGVHYESVLTGTSSVRQVMEYYSSATAQAICQGTSATLTCLPTASSGTTVTPNRLYVYAVMSSSGTFNLNVKSETSNAVSVKAGSSCRSIET